MIKDKYLKLLVDEDTQLIQEDIPTVLAYLFDLYGKVSLKKVKQKEGEIRRMSFHPADLLILLYNPIENLKKMAEAAEIPYTADQLLDIRLPVVRNTRDFERALGAWQLLPFANKTWGRFKTHFKDTQEQLRVIRRPTMQQAGYHHANHLASQLRGDIKKRNAELTNLVAPSVARTVASLDISVGSTPMHHQVNAVQGDLIQLEIIKMLQEMQQ